MSSLGGVAGILVGSDGSLNPCGCCGKAPPCCEGGGYGFLLVQLLSGTAGEPSAVYRLLTPLSIACAIDYAVDGASLPDNQNLVLGEVTGRSDPRFEWLNPQAPLTGSAVLCSTEQVSENVYRASLFTHEGASGSQGGFWSYDSAPGQPRVTVAFPLEVTVTPRSVFLRATVAENLTGGVDPEEIASFRAEASFVYTDGPAGAPIVTGGATVSVSNTIRGEGVGGPFASPRYDFARATLEACKAPLGPSAPVNFASSGLADTLALGSASGQCVPTAQTPCTPGASLPFLPTILRPLGESSLAMTASVTLGPELCGAERVHQPVNCQSPGDCILDGVVVPCECLVDPTLPQCQPVLGPCCQNPAGTPSWWSFAQNTEHEYIVFYEIQRLGTSGQVLEEWIGYGGGAVPAPGAQADCRISRSTGFRRIGQLPITNLQNSYAVRIQYNSFGGVTTIENNQFFATADFGETAPLPQGAGLRLRVLGENNNTVADLEARIPSTTPGLVPSPAMVVNGGVAGVTNLANTSRSTTLLSASPFNGSTALWHGGNMYMQIIPNPAQNFRWLGEVFLRVLSRYRVQCPPTSAASSDGCQSCGQGNTGF